jgi:hypothetical protein
MGAPEVRYHDPVRSLGVANLMGRQCPYPPLPARATAPMSQFQGNTRADEVWCAETIVRAVPYQAIAPKWCIVGVMSHSDDSTTPSMAGRNAM